MKRIITLVIQSGFLLLTFGSCQKEITSNELDSSASSNDSIYLDKVYQLDLSTMDTIVAVVLTYDSQKRVTAMASPVGSFDYTNYAYYYNGTDTLPYKSTLLKQYQNEYDTVVTYHYYDNSKRNLKDSIHRAFENVIGDYFNTITVSNYSYSADKRFGFSTYTHLDGGFSSPTGTDTATIDLNNNILFSKHYYESMAIPGTYDLSNTSTISYDTHRSPFSFLSNLMAHQNFPIGETFFFEYLPFNNMLTLDETSTGYNYTYNYTYGANGLPSTIIATSTAASTSYKIIYTYRNL